MRSESPLACTSPQMNCAAAKSDASWQLVLDRFVDRISKLSGRVDAAAVERILDNAAKAVADLEVSNEQ